MIMREIRRSMEKNGEGGEDNASGVDTWVFDIPPSKCGMCLSPDLLHIAQVKFACLQLF